MHRLNLNVLDNPRATLSSEAAMSSDLHFIRVITMDGAKVAKITASDNQEQDLAVAKLLASSARLKRALEALVAKTDMLMATRVKGSMEFALAEQLLYELDKVPGMKAIC
ncbi:hypothetical protein [Hydrogenophaga sp. NFH-34]|uniref:hypothetical protein n=1 Tax=Hydrogenophaga sp. NFH-34 TaxID=2744446 RepID=UPI001F42061E|nr:hypothetical protein [Hydrogenophaga sp. NFH-34]